MGHKRVHTHFDQRGSPHGRGQDIGRNRRHPHAQDQAEYHHRNQCQREIPPGQLHHGGAQALSQPGQRHHAHDNPGGTARRHRVHGANRTGGQRVPRLFEVYTARFHALRFDEQRRDPAQRNGQHNRSQRTHDNGLLKDRDDQDKQQQRNQQISAGAQLFPNIGQLVLGYARQLQLDRPKIHHEEYSQEVNNRWDNGRCHHRFIGNARIFRQNKRHCTHDRRHDLPPCGGRRLHSPGKLAGVAGLFHQRDGKAAGSHHVAHSAAGNRPHQRAGDDSHLGRTTAIPAGYRRGKTGKEFSHAAGGQKGCAGDEQDDIVGRRAHGRAKEALRAEQNTEYTVNTVPAMAQHTGEGRAKHSVEHENPRDNGQRPSNQAASHLNDRKQAQQRENNVHCGGLESRAVIDVLIEQDHVHHHGQGYHNANNVICHGTGLICVLCGRNHHKGQCRDGQQADRPEHEGVHGVEGQSNDVESCDKQRKR